MRQPTNPELEDTVRKQDIIIDRMKVAAKNTHQQTIEFVMKKARGYVKETTKSVTKMLQGELLNQIKQHEAVKTEIFQRDEWIKQCGVKLREQEKRILAYAARFKAAKFKIDVSE